MDRFSIRIGCSSSYFYGDVVLLSQNTGQQRQTGHDVFGPEHGSPQSDVGDICGMVLRDGHKGTSVGMADCWHTVNTSLARSAFMTS